MFFLNSKTTLTHSARSGPLWFSLIVKSILFLTASLLTSTVQGVVKHSSTNPFDPARQSPTVQAQVAFWEKVFGHLTSRQTLIHDADHPHIIIDLIDHKQLSKVFVKVGAKGQNDLTDKYLIRYRKALKRFQTYGSNALRYGAIEQRVYDVYKKHPHLLQKLKRGEINLRSQTGLADTFQRAFVEAQTYLPYIESIFRDHGLPMELTRLPFVESMFNTTAKSKVGASGIWQFMPATAQSWLKMGSMYDERNSPYKSTIAAAKFLKENYRDLKTWPLAVTAYNHGRGGMKRATKTVGTSDLGRIIESYKSRTFGFASKNFYAELLAVNNVYEHLVANQKSKVKRSTDIVAIKLKRAMSVHQLTSQTPLSEEALRRHNHCLDDKLFSTRKHYLLPANYELYLSSSMARTVQNSLGDHVVKYARR